MKNQHNVPVSVLNSRILESLDRGETEKVAQAGSDYTRIQIREDGFIGEFLPLEKASNDDLDRDLDERLRIIEELEPDSPGGKWVDLQGIPEGEYMKGSRYQVPFAKLMTRKYQKNIDELRTYKQDLKKILSDNSIKDSIAELDSKFIKTCESIAMDTSGPGQPQNETGKVQWRQFTGGLTKDNWVEAKTMLPAGNEDGKFRLENHICLMNDVTAQYWQKLDVEQIGDAAVSGHFQNGLSNMTPYGMKMITTIKDDIVPNFRVFFFPKPEFLGKGYYLRDWTMYMEKKGSWIEFFSEWLGGFAIGNVAGVCIADFEEIESTSSSSSVA